MANKQGDFIWYELMTTDPDAAARFYGDVVGWSFRPAGQEGMDYRLFSYGGTDIGGVMPFDDEMIASGANPSWLGYIAVDDVDASAQDIAATGGKIHMPPTDIPGIGRFAMVADVEGVPFYIMRGSIEGHSSQSFAGDAPRVGHCAWNELATPDPASAMAFYSRAFGWTKDGEMDMGPMGKYEFLRHGPVIGAMMPKPAELPVPGWTFYFRVADVAAAAKRAAAGGGQVLNGPQEVPGGDFIINGIDPTGAAFALVGGRGE